MNLFDFLKNYKDHNDNQTYGDILENKSAINNLSYTEEMIMEQIKNSDRQRLINSGRAK